MGLALIGSGGESVVCTALPPGKVPSHAWGHTRLGVHVTTVSLADMRGGSGCAVLLVVLCCCLCCAAACAVCIVI